MKEDDLFKISKIEILKTEKKKRKNLTSIITKRKKTHIKKTIKY